MHKGKGPEMRIFFGWLVFFVGVGALGYWAQVEHAPSIEDRVLADLSKLDVTAYDTVQFSVSGRDITVTGTVENAEARDALLRRLAELPSHRHVHTSLELNG